MARSDKRPRNDLRIQHNELERVAERQTSIHEDKADPHPVYLTEVEANALFLTQAEADALYDPSTLGRVWMPLTTVVSGTPELVWDDDDSLVPTEVPI